MASYDDLINGTWKTTLSDQDKALLAYLLTNNSADLALTTDTLPAAIARLLANFPENGTFASGKEQLETDLMLAHLLNGQVEEAVNAKNIAGIEEQEEPKYYKAFDEDGKHIGYRDRNHQLLDFEAYATLTKNTHKEVYQRNSEGGYTLWYQKMGTNDAPISVEEYEKLQKPSTPAAQKPDTVISADEALPTLIKSIKNSKLLPFISNSLYIKKLNEFTVTNSPGFFQYKHATILAALKNIIDHQNMLRTAEATATILFAGIFYMTLAYFAHENWDFPMDAINAIDNALSESKQGTDNPTNKSYFLSQPDETSAIGNESISTPKKPLQ